MIPIKKIFLIVFTLIIQNSFLGQSLDELLKQAVSNNPSLSALELKYEAIIAVAEQQGQIPQPTIGIGLPVQPIETRLGPQVVVLSASQMFPWFGTLKSEEKVYLSLAKSEYERVIAAKLELFYAVKIPYYELEYLRQKRKILLNNLELYKSLEQVSLSRVEAGKATAADVLRIQIKIEEIKKKIDEIDLEESSNEAILGQLMNNFDASINTQGDFSNPVEMNVDLLETQDKLSANHPLLRRLNALIEASEHKQSFNKGMNSPRIAVGVDYGMINERSDMDVPRNGTDVIVPKISMSIPIFRHQYKAKELEEDIIQQSLELQKLDLVNRFIGEIKILINKYENELLNIDLYSTQSSMTRSALDILLSEYSSQGTKIDEIIALQNNILNYELSVCRSTINTFKLKATIDRITDY